MPLTPKNRKEEWLQGLVDHETTLTPKNRPEEWMKEIIDASGGGGGGGGGGEVLSVRIVYGEEGAVMNKTLKEIWDALPDVAISFYDNEDEGSFNFYQLLGVANARIKRVVIYDYTEQEKLQFDAETENDYPTLVLI